MTDTTNDLRAALESALAAMEHMGDRLNRHDLVSEEDSEHFAAFEKVRAALATTQQPADQLRPMQSHCLAQPAPPAPDQLTALRAKAQRDAAATESLIRESQAVRSATPAPVQAAPLTDEALRVLRMVQATLPHIGGNFMSVHSMLNDIDSVLSQAAGSKT